MDLDHTWRIGDLKALGDFPSPPNRDPADKPEWAQHTYEEIYDLKERWRLAANKLAGEVATERDKIHWSTIGVSFIMGALFVWMGVQYAPML